MLSRANADLVARDPALPALALLLDPPVLTGLLRGCWPDLELSELEHGYLRYKPGTSCLAGFRLRIGGEQTWLTFTARRHDASDKLAKVAMSRGVNGPFGAGWHLFPDLALAMACFPNDPRLKRMRRLAEPPARMLRKLDLPETATVSPLRYRPERRFVGQVSVAGAPVATIKFHGPAAFRRALANAAAFAATDQLEVPRVIGSSHRHGAIASEWLDGPVAAAEPVVGQRIGAALAALHRQSPCTLTRLTDRQQQRSARAIARDIAQVVPALTGEADALACRLAPLLAHETPLATLHGDCHIEQCIDRGDRIALIDFDKAAHGPAAWDLGNLLAHLDAAATQRHDGDTFIAALVDGYRSAGGVVDSRDLAANRALGLLRLALLPFREQRDDWPDQIADLLARAAAICPSPARPLARQAVPMDPGLPQLTDALTTEIATRAFGDAGLPLRVQSARLVRHKPGRRCLIAYDLVDAAGQTFRALGKMRAKGADSRVFALHQALRDHGLAPGGPMGACVPEPLALVPRLAMWLQAEVRGTAFPADDCPPEQAASAIAALHSAQVRPHRRHLLGDELAILETRLDDLAIRRGDWADRLARLWAAAQQQAAQALPVELRPIHRDFYQDHLLRDGGVIHLVDLDLVSLGDPAVDIGNFSAHLTELALRQHRDAERFVQWQARFVHAACHGPHAANPVNVRIYEFLTLLRLVEIDDRMPGRRDCAEDLLQLCEWLANATPARFRRPT